MTHGTVSGYKNHGCRCPGCRQAHTADRAHRRERQRRQLAECRGIFPPPTPIDPYVQWWLSTHGDEAHEIARDFMLGGGLDGLDTEEEAA